eukprot:TRINITY_DN696_c1_g2_i1.p1 TRINITY_DN696_c1_g2~~TRINITY_DN696_c1_g2_i1.p1  ORF type:complete len:757 (+),score=113.31 TRINITY_DN696_c1_g2_i1:93-2363(+)
MSRRMHRSTASKILQNLREKRQRKLIIEASHHNIFVDTQGKVYGWGKNNKNQLGNAYNRYDIPYQTIPSLLPFKKQVVAVSCETNTTLFLTSKGYVYVTNSGKKARKKASLSNIVAISSGLHFSLALDSSGIIYAWGSNKYGQLGIGNFARREDPQQILINVEFSSISCGSFHSVAITNEGDMYTWGRNDHYQLGFNIDSDRVYEPTPVSYLPVPPVSVVCGNLHTLFLGNNGKIYACGNNSEGQCGNGSKSITESFTKVSVNSYVVSVTSGLNHCAAITNDGSVYVWGKNKYFEAGREFSVLGIDTDISYKMMPSKLPIKNIARICCGNTHTIILDENNEIWSFGSNHFGQLGVGDINERDIPTRVMIPEYSCIELIGARKFVNEIKGEIILYGKVLNIPYVLLKHYIPNYYDGYFEDMLIPEYDQNDIQLYISQLINIMCSYRIPKRISLKNLTILYVLARKMEIPSIQDFLFYHIHLRLLTVPVSEELSNTMKIASENGADQLYHLTIYMIVLYQLDTSIAFRMGIDPERLTEIDEIIIAGNIVPFYLDVNKWNEEYLDSLMEDIMLEILDSEVDTDITLVIGDHEIRCHKSILSSIPYFDSMFHFKKGVERTIVDIRIHPYSSFMSLIKYIYSRKEEVITASDAIYIMESLPFYGLDQFEELLNICRHQISNIENTNVADSENLIHSYIAAKKFGKADIMETVINLVDSRSLLNHMVYQNNLLNDQNARISQLEDQLYNLLNLFQNILPDNS